MASKEGYLTKWTNIVTRWKRRYFKLQDGVLIYSKNTQSRPKEIISLSTCKIQPNNKKPLVFSVYTGIKTLHMRAASN